VNENSTNFFLTYCEFYPPPSPALYLGAKVPPLFTCKKGKKRDQRICWIWARSRSVPTNLPISAR